MNITELEQENQNIEYKLCSNKLPVSFWETYSSFANTNGGIIVLGIEEKNNGQFSVEGVQNPDKIVSDIFNLVSNAQKASRNILTNDSVKIETHSGKSIILVKIEELSPDKKPLYINNNPKHTYLRRHGGDYQASDSERYSIIRNTYDNIDNELLDGYDLTDLDMESILKFKTIVQRRDPDTDYLSMDNLQFLLSMGVFQLDRNDNKEPKLTLGGLLFLGKYNAIISRLPHYHLDYFNKKGAVERWKDRVASGELLYPNLNILNYYLLVLDKLTATINDTFALDTNLTRKTPIELNIALREALVNMLIHADYLNSSTALYVEVYDTYYLFINPGAMRITKHSFFIGGNSNPRNNVLTTLFRRLGASERAGTGGPKIFDVVKKNKFRNPELEILLDKTKLKLWAAELKESYPDLSENAHIILTIFSESDNPNLVYSSPQLMEKTGFSRHHLNKAINELKSRNLLSQVGKNKSTKYMKAVSSLEVFDALTKACKTFEQIISQKNSDSSEKV